MFLNPLCFLVGFPFGISVGARYFKTDLEHNRGRDHETPGGQMVLWRQTLSGLDHNGYSNPARPPQLSSSVSDGLCRICDSAVAHVGY